ncbi:MAG: carbohydrate-binding protein, partial [Bacteroidia bacterium]|nr:carbohydrate-binding protein [Bacteroidia bacterium]
FNLSSIEFISSTDPEPPFQPLGATVLENEKTIRLTLNHPLQDNQSILLEYFDVKINGESKTIESIQFDSLNSRVILIEMVDFLYHQQNITLDHIGGVFNSIFNDVLPQLVNFQVANNLPSRIYIPGKIEAEDFINQSGLQTENTSDSGGGLNVGWTDIGDFAEYQVYVGETGIYDLNLRTSAQSQQGILQFEIINNESTQSLGWFSIPITGGWQSWTTNTFETNLDKGVYTLKMTILQPGFNINWFEFIYSDENLSVNDFHINKDEMAKVFPNPVTEKFNVKVSKDNQIQEIMLFDVNGRTIHLNEIKINSNEAQLIIPEIDNGVYLLSIVTKDGNYFKRVLKTQY